MPIVAVALGGACGAVARYLVTGAVHRAFGQTWPWGTMTVNVVGGLLVGLCAGALTMREGGGQSLWALFLIVGVCGGFTTFSAYSLETVRLWQSGAVLTAVVATGVQVIGSLAATGAGLWIIRQF